MVAILANIRSLHNVGSIFRTADAVGIEKLYLAGITPAPVDRFGQIRLQFAKVSLGAEKFMAWDALARSTPAILKLIDRLKKDGYKIWAVEQSKKSLPYYRATTPRGSGVALVVGNEVRGLSPAILKKCDKILEIPMRGEKESLNVAVAFGIVAFHLLNSH